MGPVMSFALGGMVDLYSRSGPTDGRGGTYAPVEEVSDVRHPSMEEWLDATGGSGPCRSGWGESECRTVEVRGTAFEAIPQRLILSA